jgi:deoxyribodipyrimidine photo-lyase
MRELNQTGFMSNRGRVNCASFLTRDYQIDWRWGAAWFEKQLLDYDVCSNWLNWNTQATEIWYTNPIHQGYKYDKNGDYVRFGYRN